jgi:hypothetical protein
MPYFYNRKKWTGWDLKPTTSARCNDKSLPYLKEAAAMGRDNLAVQATLPLSDYMPFHASLSKKKKD